MDSLMCGFVPMQGAGAHQGAVTMLRDDDLVALWQDEGDVTDTSQLAGVLSAPRVLDKRHTRLVLSWASSPVRP